MTNKQPSFIERMAEKLGLIPDLQQNREPDLERIAPEGELTQFPPMEQWDDWTEYEATEHPKRVKRNYTIVPTTCFNCESACGLTAYVDKDSHEIRKFEGNPHHPAAPQRNSFPKKRISVSAERDVLHKNLTCKKFCNSSLDFFPDKM